MAMSQEERDGLDWLRRVRDGLLTQRKANHQQISASVSPGAEWA